MLAHFTAIFKNRAARESFRVRAFIVALFLSVFFAIFEYSFLRERVQSEELYTAILFILITIVMIVFYYIIIVMEDGSIRDDIIDANEKAIEEGTKDTILDPAATMIHASAKYDALYHNKTIGVFEYDADGYLIKCNSRAIEIFGYQEEEIFELNLLGAKVNTALKAAIRDSLEYGSGYCNGFVTKHGNNKVTKNIVVTYGVKNSSGTVMGGVGVIKDETDFGTLWKTE